MSQVFEPALVASLAKLADYTPNAVLSRTLLKNSAGTVTIFAFSKGQGLSAHSAPFDAFVQVLEGTARITIDGQDHDMGMGEVILMPADHPHAVHATSDFKMLLTMLKGR